MDSRMNLFESEKKVLREADSFIDNEQYKDNPLLDQYKNLSVYFEKLLKEIEKIIRISDGQQEYLHKVQEELRQEIEKRMYTEQKLRYLATNDVLTGVYNRGMGLSLLDKQLKLFKRDKEVFSICYIDVNGLKSVNDVYGHSEGDELLIAICSRIKESIRECDTICRLGGDEFLVIFPQCNADGAQVVLDRIMLDIGRMNKEKIKPYTIQFSYGIVQVDQDNSKSIDELIEMADMKMYQHKELSKRISV